MKNLKLRRQISFVIIIVYISLVASAQTPDRGTDLVTVIASVDHKVIRAGQNLGVTVTLTAGSKGAWLPNHFGDFYENCHSGFSADILTEQGKRASDANKSCAGDWILGKFIPSEELKHYVFLEPRESRNWRTTLKQITHTPGTYQIEAEYLAAENRIEQVAALPEVRGLMVMGHVRAKPVQIRIR